MRYKGLLALLLAFSLLFISADSIAKTKKHTTKKNISKSLEAQEKSKNKSKRKACLKKRSLQAKNRKGKIRLAKRARSQKIGRALTARSAIIMDADSGEIYFGKDPYIPLQPASTIKIVTGLLALEKLDENDPVRVSHYAESAPRQKAYLRCGAIYPARDLIYATLIHSANDASRALAEKIAGSEKDFARLMTETAHSLGAKRTVCRTATGLTARGQATTAYDLAVMFNKAMQNDRFADILKTRKFEIQGGKFVFNHNKALWQINGAEGGKTGFTEVARRTYVGMFKRGDRSIIIAFLGSTDLWGDVRVLVKKAYSETGPVIQARKPGSLEAWRLASLKARGPGSWEAGKLGGQTAQRLLIQFASYKLAG